MLSILFLREKGGDWECQVILPSPCIRSPLELSPRSWSKNCKMLHDLWYTFIVLVSINVSKGKKFRFLFLRVNGSRGRRRDWDESENKKCAEFEFGDDDDDDDDVQCTMYMYMVMMYMYNGTPWHKELLLELKRCMSSLTEFCLKRKRRSAVCNTYYVLKIWKTFLRRT